MLVVYESITGPFVRDLENLNVVSYIAYHSGPFGRGFLLTCYILQYNFF